MTVTTVNDCDGNSHVVRIGDFVCFKSDIEQSGKIVEIIHGNYLDIQFKLHRESGFEGHYIGGEEYTIERATDCWVE